MLVAHPLSLPSLAEILWGYDGEHRSSPLGSSPTAAWFFVLLSHPLASLSHFLGPRMPPLFGIPLVLLFSYRNFRISVSVVFQIPARDF